MKKQDTPTTGNTEKRDVKPAPVKIYRSVPCLKVDGDTATKTPHEVVVEDPIAVFVNGRHAVTAVMSPVELEDFVTGYLFTEQIIKGVDEIESIKIEKNRISVITTNLFKVLGPKKTILSGCGGSTSYIDAAKLPKIQSPLTISADAIRDAQRSLPDSEVHRTTGGIHMVALLNRKQVITIAEDIGRHNAVDRVIGYGLRHHVDFSQTYVISSGRISSEMVRKCLIANIPIVVSRSATTTLAVEIAQETGLTVIAFARGGKMNIYTHPERIVDENPVQPTARHSSSSE
ncbi:MAG: formate dehydrogenase accessory sulfurtransferase FdhD [Methanoregula sp.]|nr:formate dehydrogenase accessory sulfurtransferase FdhD [Methanoregula sp.]